MVYNTMYRYTLAVMYIATTTIYTSTLVVNVTRLLSSLAMYCTIAGRICVSENETVAILGISNDNRLWDLPV